MPAPGPSHVVAAVGEKDHDPAGQNGGPDGHGQGDGLVLPGGQAAEEDAGQQTRGPHDPHGPTRSLLGGPGGDQFFLMI